MYMADMIWEEKRQVKHKNVLWVTTFGFLNVRYNNISIL